MPVTESPPTDAWPAQPGTRPPLPGTASPPIQGRPTTTPASSSWVGPTLDAEAAGNGDGPRGGRTRTFIVVGLVVLVAVLSSLTTFLLIGGDDDESTEETAGPSTTQPADEQDDPAPTTTAPPAGGGAPTPPTTAAGPTVTEDELVAEVRELQDFVATARGREFKQDVTVELLDDAAFEQRLLEAIDEDRDDIEIQGRVLSALGLIEPDVDVLEATEQALSQGVLGFYETEMNELVVRGTELTPYVRQTIVHELVHAFDDQWFELYRPEYDDRDDEISQGFRSILEGNARRIEADWVDTLSEDERRERNREEALAGLNADYADVPEILIGLLVSPYEDGLVLVTELADLGGEAVIDQALETPPTTTEQVLLPEKYLVLEEGLDVPPPPADGEIIADGAFGMLMIQLMLSDVLSDSQAFQGAVGWGGDSFVAWEDGEDSATTCVRIDVEMESPSEAQELLNGLEAYRFEHGHVEIAERGDTGARIDACTPPPDGGGGGSRL